MCRFTLPPRPCVTFYGLGLMDHHAKEAMLYFVSKHDSKVRLFHGMTVVSWPEKDEKIGKWVSREGG